MNLPLKIASRASPLALAQVEEIIRAIAPSGVIARSEATKRSFKYEILKFETAGDKDKITPLTDSRDDFFTDAIDGSLLEGKADIAVHSAKDLPQNLHEDLKIFALTEGLDDKDAWVGRVHWKDLPQKAKVGTSSVLRQKQVLEMRPDATIVNIRGTINERLQLIKEGKVDGIVAAACALKRLKLERKIKDIFPWEGMPLQGQLAVVGRRGEHELEDLFGNIDVRRHYGKVTLIGAGPGDCELITLKGVKALATADCVFYDYLVDDGLLKYAPLAEHIYAGKRKGDHSLSQDDLSRMLKKKAFAGKKVVRLKGGDPLIFGRGADEIQYLRSYHIEVDIIPGVSSATGIPSSLGIPLTARGVSSSVAFLSGHEGDEDKGRPKLISVPRADTLVFLMGLTKLSIIVKSLQKSGWSPRVPMMIIANGTKPEEQIVKGSLSTIEGLARDLKPPALIVVGKTIEFYKPNKGAINGAPAKTFLHCGTHPQMYGHLGKILRWPMIEIKPVSLSGARQKKLLKSFGSADLIICTSRYAVEYFIKALQSVIARSPRRTTVSAGHDDQKHSGVNSAAKKFLKEQLENKIFAVIGRRTQEALQKYGIQPAIVSREETARGLLKAITRHMNVKGRRILFPRSSLPNPFLKDALSARGAIVEEMTIYVNTKPAKRDLPPAGIEGAIFTSPSTVRNFLADYGTIPASWAIMAKGQVTLKTLKEAGYNHAISLS